MASVSPFVHRRDLEASVEELQNDVKSKQCYVTMNDVESFALVLSTISRSLVDLKGTNEESIVDRERSMTHFFLSCVQLHFQYCVKSSRHWVNRQC